MQVLYGFHPVMELLKSGKGNILSVFLDKDRKDQSAEEIYRLAGRRNIPVKRENRAALDRLSGGAVHQGILALTEDFTYSSLDSILDRGKENHAHDLLLVLDSITDPQNLGSLIRSAHCFGVRALIIPKDRAAQVTPAVIKASAGSALYTPLCRVTNIAVTVEQLKKEGYWIYGADTTGEHYCGAVSYNRPTVLVLGSEGTGLRPLVRKKCDCLVRIPMAGMIDSLNVSVAGGILIYEVMRDRLSTPPQNRSQDPRKGSNEPRK